MDLYKITTDDGCAFSYTISLSGDTSGYSMYTIPIIDIIESTLKKITKKMISDIYLMTRDRMELRQCNITKEELEGKYFDKDGNIYYVLGDELYKFNMNLKYFEKLYRNDRKGTITHRHENHKYGLRIVLFDDGSAAAIDVNKKIIFLESGEDIDWFMFVALEKEVACLVGFLKKLMILYHFQDWKNTNIVMIIKYVTHKINIKQNQRRITGLYTLALTGRGFRSARSVATLIPTPHFTHIFLRP